jgi:hypothetical protein
MWRMIVKRNALLGALILGVTWTSLSGRPLQTPSERQHLQFAYGKLMGINEVASMTQGNGMYRMGSVEGLHLPYTAPTGYRIGVTGMYLSSKMNDRSSYMVIDSVFSLPDRVPSVVFSEPVWLRPGTTLLGTIINNSGEPQWMVGIIQVVIEPIGGA